MAKELNLYEAAHKGDFETVVEKVTQNKALITLPDNNSRILLHWAALSGNVELVSFLIERGSPIDPLDDTGTTPLILTASAGKYNIVQILIDHKADVNCKNEQGHSALQYASSKGWLEIVKMLLEQNADINICDARGATPLHRAASKGNLSIVKLLLDNKAIKIDYRDHYGNSALHLACEEDRVEEAKLLVTRGANLNLTNKERRTPLDYCSRSLAAILIGLINK